MFAPVLAFTFESNRESTNDTLPSVFSFSVLTYKTEEEAIFIANDHDYGLAAAVWTKDTNSGIRIANGM